MAEKEVAGQVKAGLVAAGEKVVQTVKEVEAKIAPKVKEIEEKVVAAVKAEMVHIKPINGQSLHLGGLVVAAEGMIVEKGSEIYHRLSAFFGHYLHELKILK